MKCTIEEFKEIIASSTNHTEVMTKLGYSSPWPRMARKLVTDYVKELGLDTSHIKLWGSLQFYEHKILPLEQILVKESKYLGGGAHLKRRLISNNVLKNECYICGLTNWQDQPITLQIDHINGVNNDNRIENLRILCPNCHSQTPTFTGRKNKGKGINNGTCKCGKVLKYRSKSCKSCLVKDSQTRQWPEDEELFSLVKEHGLNYVAKKYEVVRKHLVKRLKTRKFDLTPYINT